jgi:PAS domain S-box-containing protein
LEPGTHTSVLRPPSPSRPLSRRTTGLSPVSRYGFAVAVSAAAILIRLALDPLWGLKLPYITLFPAIMLSAWIGGLWPGVVATLLTAVAAEYFWIEPAGSWTVRDPSEIAGLALFAAMGVFISGLNEAWRRGLAAVAASEERLRVTIHSLGDAVIATDERGRVTQVNPVAEALTGWTQEDAQGRPLTDVLVIVNEDTRRPAANPVERVLREGTIAGLANHTLLISRTGREVPIDDSAAPVKAVDGRIAGAVMVFRDITDRRRAERERTDRERVSRELAAIVESSEDAIVGMALDGTISAWNHAAERMYGYGADEAIGRSIRLIVPEDRVGEEDRVLERLRLGERVEHFETVRRRKDRSEFPVSLTISPVLGTAGQVVGVSKTARDITSRKQSERTIAEQAQLLQTIDDAIYEMDPELRITSWNQAAERMYGYTAGEALGRKAFELLQSPVSLAERDANLKRLQTGEVLRTEAQLRRKDGSMVWADVTALSKRQPDGTLEGFVAVHRDVTARKRADERFRLAVEAAPAAMVLVDQRGTIVLTNALTEQVLGYTRDEMVGQSVERLVPLRSRRPHASLRAGFFSEAHARPMGAGRDLYALRKDGSEVPVEIGLSPIETSDGRFVLAAVTDISARKRVEAEVERASRLKDEFLAVLSHELRTPLNAVVGYAHLLASGALRPERARHAVEAIQRNALAQARLVESLLDLSRVLAGKLELDLAPLDLAKVLDAAIDVIRPEADAKRIVVDPGPLSDAIAMVGDANRLQQVFWNLLSNAVKFTPECGRIQIRVTRDDAHVHIQVTDTGQGMPPEFLPYVFDRFRQEDTRRGKSPSGLGLGLAVAREMVQAHAGTVVAHSDGEGQGSTFTVTLPTTLQEPSRGQLTADDAESAEVSSLAGLDVLVVDDDGDVRELFSFLLESRGATVRAASSANEALEAAHRKRPDVILADVRMPDEDGYSLIRKLRAQERQRQLAPVPAVAVTAYASAADKEKAIAAGYDWHVAKPIDPSALTRLIARLANLENA